MLANLFSSIRQYIFPPNQGPSPVPDFPVLDDSRPDDKSLPAFMVSRTRGFLPRADPIIQLPSEFAVLQSLLDRMPIVRADGSPGLLATGDFGAAVEAELPDLRPEIEKYKHDLPLINALYREYSFLISAYLLEPCKCAPFSGNTRFILCHFHVIILTFSRSPTIPQRGELWACTKQNTKGDCLADGDGSRYVCFDPLLSVDFA